MDQWNQLLQNISSRPKQNNPECEKIFNGPSGIIPGWEQLLIDRFGSFLFVVTYRPLEEEQQEGLIGLLGELYPLCKLRIQYRSAGRAEDLYLSADCPERIEVKEHGITYLVHTSRGQNPGFFADMINGRKAVMDYIDRSRQESESEDLLPVLNLFAYTCSFSVAALKGGASRVDNWDMNKYSLAIGKKNHEINKLDPRLSSYFGYDIFKSFGKIKKRGPYSLVILDPPPQQGSSFQYKKDYPRLMQRLEQILAPAGAVLFCLNASDFGKQDFLDMINAETPGTFDHIDDIPCPPEYLGRFPDRGLKTFLASGYNPKKYPEEGKS
ncbi:class I SAM-dependent methyltransferase [Oceanispirochaeta sp.]|jgi:23S rRNA (cytosine1962-C5)-methyltransferase|uniref:class I SAM-dependent methyltransferase n=1 Tax=Oceanispirochaeta sp. TaxID=2035350 RepID=UPI00260E0A58|nr:class I SAM-dependent methyltransferase [Oceanispirochaeta sp.]MDA3958550.1 class I SAM-dependent methyltransferase [Oceanispirochaeta sp.]